MITDFVLNAIFSGINALLGLMPTMSLPSSNPYSTWIVDVYELNRIIPVVLIGTFLVAFLTIRVAMQGWDFILFVYHQFWGSGS